MTIVQVVQPGGWLDYPSEQKAAQELEALLRLLVHSHLPEANLALLLFEQPGASEATYESIIDEWQRDTDEHSKVMQRMRSQLPQGQRLSNAEWWEQVMLPTDKEVLRARAERGQLPSALLHQAPFIYAKAFVYALDGIVKVLEVIEQHQSIPNSAAAALAQLKQQVPDVVNVRDSGHHVEDRIRGLDKKGDPIALQPIDNNLVKGTALMVNILNGSRYGCTLGDGRYAEIDVTADSLVAARDAIQLVLDSLTWRGRPMLFPNWR